MQYISTEPNYQSLAIPFSKTTRNKGKWCLQLTECNMDRNGGITMLLFELGHLHVYSCCMYEMPNGLYVFKIHELLYDKNEWK